MEIIRGNKVSYFRGNYSFLNLAKLVKEHKSAETIQESRLFAEIRYQDDKMHHEFWKKFGKFDQSDTKLLFEQF